MPLEITNKKRSISVVRIEGTGTNTIYLANLASDASETVTAAEIKRLMWSTNGVITIVRNSQNIATLHSAGEMRFDEYGHSVANNSTSSIVVTVTTGGTLYIEVSKQAGYSPALSGM